MHTRCHWLWWTTNDRIKRKRNQENAKLLSASSLQMVGQMQSQPDLVLADRAEASGSGHAGSDMKSEVKLNRKGCKQEQSQDLESQVCWITHLWKESE